MPKPQKKPRASTPDRRGVFGQRGKTPRVGLYARVSTHDQQTLPMQMSAMRDYAKRRRWAVAVEVKDVGYGATMRPKREKLIEAARRREIDLVLVWRLDRWGRSLVDLVSTLQELNALEVGFVSHGRPMTAGKLVPEMKQLRKDGLSKRAIAKRLGVSRTSVIRLLRLGSARSP